MSLLGGIQSLESANDVGALSDLSSIARAALAEDLGLGDATTAALVPESSRCTATFVVKETGIIAGWDIVRAVFAALDLESAVQPSVHDGHRAAAGARIAVASGTARAILTGERTALNFLQRMSGIATATRQFVDAVAGTKAVILDTRKTAPGLRALDKHAVRMGGGQNHRFGLFDMMLIKENHIALAGGIRKAVLRARAKNPRALAIEVEVRNLDELREALEVSPDRILLDNMPLSAMQEAVRIDGGRIPVEASGNVTLENVRGIAETGVDFISVGTLTHSAKALDISLLVEYDQR